MCNNEEKHKQLTFKQLVNLVNQKVRKFLLAEKKCVQGSQPIITENLDFQKISNIFAMIGIGVAELRYQTEQGVLQRKFCDLVKGKRIWPYMPHQNPQRKLELNTPANLMPTKHLSSYQQDSFSCLLILQRVTTSFSHYH